MTMESRRFCNAEVAALYLFGALFFALLHLMFCLQEVPNDLQIRTPLDWEADDLGVDMFPEKSYSLGRGGECWKTDSAPAPANDEDTGVVQQLQRFVDTQRQLLEQLEQLIELLRQSVDKLQYDFSATQTRVPAGKDPGDDVRLKGSERIFGPEETRSVDFLDVEDGRISQEAMVALEQKSDLVSPVQKDVPWSSGSSQSGVLSHRPSQGNERGDASSGGYSTAAGVTIARYKPAWSEYFQFLSAFKIDGEVTCLHVLPHDGEEGVSRYVVIGDNKGRVYIFLSHGNLLVEFSTISHSSVTAMRSFSLKRNETVLVTGHLDGAVLVHEIFETARTGRSLEDDWYALSMEYVESLLPPLSQVRSVAGSQSNGMSSQMSEEGTDSNSNSDVAKPITNLEIYRVGKMRYVLVSDAEGKIQVFRENGTFYGMVKSPTRPLAFLRSPNTQRLLFLTETGAASLDLRSMKVRTGPCEGLNGSNVIAYAFDAASGSKAYGLTAQGDMVYVLLSGDTLHFECHVRSKMKVQMERPLALHGIRGYLLAAVPNQIYVFNTTLQDGFAYRNFGVSGPRHLFTASVDEVSVSFVNTPIARSHKPVMACNGEKLVVLGFGNGYVGVYRSNLPVLRIRVLHSKFWSTPVLMSIAVLLGGWMFIGRKRELAPTWMPMPDFPPSCSSTTGLGYARNGAGEAESLMEHRHFSSHSRDFSHSSSSYGRNSLNYRPSAVDHSFRTTPVNFRASIGDPSFVHPTAEPMPYSLRENFFSSTQPD